MAFLDNQGVSKLCALLKDKFDSLWTAVNGKQGALTAGSNITISDGVISATDTTYTAGTNVSISNGVISATDTNTTYTAGTGINIDANNEISCTVSGGGDNYSVPYNIFTLIKNNAVAGQMNWKNSFGNNISANDVPEATSSEIYNQIKAQGFAFVKSPTNNNQIDISDIINEFDLTYISSYSAANSNSQNGNTQYMDYISLSEGIYLILLDNKTFLYFKTPDALTTFITWPSSSGSSLPSTPSNDGTYLLKCVVSSGTPTYSWESVTVGGSY